jgi:hypothetical protein
MLDSRIERFLAEAAVAGGNLAAQPAEDGLSADFQFAAAQDRRFRASLDEFGDARLEELA